MVKHDLPLPVAARNLHRRCDYRKVEYEDMNSDEILTMISLILSPIHMVPSMRKGKLYAHPIWNTSKDECYVAIYQIKELLQKIGLLDSTGRSTFRYEFVAELREEVVNRLSEDIQHVGYSQEACGYEK